MRGRWCFIFGIDDALIGAGLTAAGRLIGGKMQQDQSEAFAREQMDFQERMSSTAHQREVQDLRAAGLNPILSTRLGGSSSPSGAMGTAVNFVGDAVEAGFNSAVTGFKANQEVDSMKAAAGLAGAQTTQSAATTQNVAADTENKKQDYYTKVQESERTRQQVQLTEQETRNKKQMENILRSTSQSAAAQASIDRHVERYAKSDIGKWMTYIGSAGKSLNPFGNLLNSGKSLLD